MKIKNWLRLFIAVWFLLGWIIHVYLGIFNPGIYQVFGTTALFPFERELWTQFIMPHISFFAFLLAVFEIFVGCLLISKGKWVKYGLILSILFSLFLIQLGLGAPATNGFDDFLQNRMANSIFILLHIPLFFGNFNQSIPELIKSKFKRESN